MWHNIFTCVWALIFESLGVEPLLLLSLLCEHILRKSASFSYVKVTHRIKATIIGAETVSVLPVYATNRFQTVCCYSIVIRIANYIPMHTVINDERTTVCW